LIKNINIAEKSGGGLDTLAFAAFFFVGWFIFPVISVFIFLALLYKFNFDRRVETFLFFLMALSFGLVAYTTQSVGIKESDIARYYFSYSLITDIQATKIFLLSFLLYGNDNPLFFAITFLLTRLFPNNPQILPMFWVSVTYFFSFLTIRECVLYFSPESRKTYILIIFFACIGIITFFTVTEILKQVASVSVFGYALMLKLTKKRGAAALLLVSVLIHFSSLLLLPVYYLCTKQKILRYLPFLFFISLVLSFFNFNEILVNIISLFVKQGDLLNRLQYYQDIQRWTISFRFYAEFILYFLIIILLYWDYFIAKTQKDKNQKRPFLVLHSIAFFILLINRGNVHNFIRYIMGYFPFYIMAMVQLFHIRIVKNEKIALILFAACFYFYSNVKLLSAQTVRGGEYANSYMNNNVTGILSSNVVNFLNFRVK